MLPSVGADWAAAEQVASQHACSPFCAAADRRACWHWLRHGYEPATLALRRLRCYGTGARAVATRVLAWAHPRL
eukprot:6476372-Prymnesium_polylepis.1